MDIEDCLPFNSILDLHRNRGQGIPGGGAFNSLLDLPCPVIPPYHVNNFQFYPRFASLTSKATEVNRMPLSILS